MMWLSKQYFKRYTSILHILDLYFQNLSIYLSILHAGKGITVDKAGVHSQPDLLYL